MIVLVQSFHSMYVCVCVCVVAVWEMPKLIDNLDISEFDRNRSSGEDFYRPIQS